MKILITHSFRHVFDIRDGKPIGDPGMTLEGRKVIHGLSPFVSNLFPNGAPSFVASGSGRRHLEIAECLSFPVNFVTPLFGGPESLATVEEKKKIVLASGRMIDYEAYRTGVVPEAAMNVLHELPDNLLICTGRPVILFGFGIPEQECKGGAVYEVKCGETDVSLTLLRDGIVLSDAARMTGATV